jgi:tRNA(fMet)-specific endonuclease VapC
MSYLLDTNILSDLIRNPGGRTAARIAEVGEAAVCTSIIVAAELRYGAQKKNSERLSAQLERVLSALTIIAFEPPADHAYGQLRTQLESAGAPIGANDMLIAAHAMALDYVVVTANVREFSRIAGLRVENWMA